MGKKYGILSQNKRSNDRRLVITGFQVLAAHEICRQRSNGQTARHRFTAGARRVEVDPCHGPPGGPVTGIISHRGRPQRSLSRTVRSALPLGLHLIYLGQSERARRDHISPCTCGLWSLGALTVGPVGTSGNSTTEQRTRRSRRMRAGPINPVAACDEDMRSRYTTAETSWQTVMVL
ncbi:hypothetical protein BKA93DRAFT_813383 [Sparassis latifolia]